MGSADYLRKSAALIGSLADKNLLPLLNLLAKSRETKVAVWVIGNGGSQANASHLVLHLQEHGIRAHDLLAESARITALSNDFDYSQVASRTIRALGNSGDILVVISGSGDSPNVVLALVEARRLGMHTCGLLGFSGGQALDLCLHVVVVTSEDYGCIEDAHSALIHAIHNHLLTKREEVTTLSS